MSLTQPDSKRFSLHDPTIAALRAAAGDRQAACLRGHRELDSKVARHRERGGNLTDASRAAYGDLGLARLSAGESRRFKQQDHISRTPSRQRTIKERKDG
jgi:2-oxo-4-hydroxy-4-carboxy--5-ureidoimidazoline (OHCU) decarboxylase